VFLSPSKPFLITLETPVDEAGLPWRSLRKPRHRRIVKTGNGLLDTPVLVPGLEVPVQLAKRHVVNSLIARNSSARTNTAARMAWSNGFKSMFWIDNSTARTSISSRSVNTSIPGFAFNDRSRTSRLSNSVKTAASYLSSTRRTIAQSSGSTAPSLVAQARYFRRESAGVRRWNFVRIGYRASVKQAEGMYNRSSPRSAFSANVRAAGSRKCAGAA